MSRGVKKYGQNEYLEQGEHPIIDQGKKAIAGYSNEQLGMFKNVPAIVFGDHTRVFKYVDRPFFIGADGVKILKPLLSDNVLFWYYALCAANIENLGYSRHFKLLKEKSFLNPSHEDQASITQILETVDEQISLSNSLLSTLDDLVKSQFIEMFGDPIRNEKGYPEKRLGELLEIARGGSPRPIKDYLTNDPEGINWIKIGDTVEGSRYINSTAERIKPEGKAKSREVKAGDFLLSNSMSFGRPYILNIDGCIHDGWLVLSDSRKRFNKVFLCELLGSSALKAKFSSSVRGGVVNNLNIDLVANTVVPYPPLSLQQQFADFVARVDKLGFDCCRMTTYCDALFSSVSARLLRTQR